MSAIVTLLSRNGRRSGTGRSVNSLGKKDVCCAADGVVAETLDGGTERNAATLSATRTSNQSAGIAAEIARCQQFKDPNWVTASVAPRSFPNRLNVAQVNIHGVSIAGMNRLPVSGGSRGLPHAHAGRDSPSTSGLPGTEEGHEADAIDIAQGRQSVT